MNKSAVFQEWWSRNVPVAPFSVGGGGAMRGPNAAPNALEDLVANLRRKYGPRAPAAVARTEQAVRDALGPAFQSTPAGMVNLGRRTPEGLPKSQAMPKGAFIGGGRPLQQVSVFDPTSPEGRVTAFHEAGHLADPGLGTLEGAMAYKNGLMLRAERAATRDALSRLAGDPTVDPAHLFRAYGTYLQEKFPVPESVRQHMAQNPIRERAMALREANVPVFLEGVQAQDKALRRFTQQRDVAMRRINAAAEARVEALKPIIIKLLAKKGVTLPPNANVDQMARQYLLESVLPRVTVKADPPRELATLGRLEAQGVAALKANPRYEAFQAAGRAVRGAERVADRNANTPAQKIEQLKTLPENLRPQMQDWFDAQRRRIDIAFGPGSGQQALAPIIQHIGWGT